MTAPVRRIVLPAGETDPARQYSLLDPRVGREAWARIYRATYYGEGDVTRADLRTLLSFAADYVALTCDHTQTDACAKLRDLRRAMREEAT